MKKKDKPKKKDSSERKHFQLSEERKALIRKVSGVLFAVLALFTLLAVSSYLFTWKADQSLLSDPQMMQVGKSVSNMAGKIGYRWSELLVSKCFGLGSYALVFLLALSSAKLLSSKWQMGWLKTIFLSVSGAYVCAIILSFVGRIFGEDVAFGGGLGGACGSATVLCLSNLLGMFVTGLAVIFVTVLWLIVASRRFSDWFVSLGKKKDEEIEADLDALDAMEDLPFEEETTVESVQEEPAPAANPSPAPDAPVATELDASANFSVEDGDGYSTDVKKEVAADLPPLNIRDEVSKYKFPSIDLLEDYASSQHAVSKAELETINQKIQATLLDYKIQVESVTAVIGPSVTLYRVIPSKGVKISAIKNIEEDIAMSLGTRGVRVVTLPDCVGIEVANEVRSIVPLKSMFNDNSYRNSKAELPVAIGYTIHREVKTFDLADAPHLLVAGATKQGKSVGLNVIIASLLYKKHPAELKFVFIDPKMVEFSAYSSLLHHYLAVLPTASSEDDEISNCIVKKPKAADDILKSLCVEMDERYELLSKARVNKVTAYNQKFSERKLLPTEGHKFLPYLVVVVDEFADLTMSGNGSEGKATSRSVTNSIVRLAQKGRAAGIHVIIATQRPSVDVVTPLIKTNFPTRIAFRTVTRFDSGTILDSPGAEKLTGNGDMLYYAGVEMERVQCAYVSMDEISKITDFIGAQDGYRQRCSQPYYLPMPPAADGEGDSDAGMVDMQHLDARFEDAARLVVTTQRGSTSDLQRKLGIGYAKAGRIMDQLEAAGIVGPQDGSKPRQVLVDDFAALENILASYLK